MISPKELDWIRLVNSSLNILQTKRKPYIIYIKPYYIIKISISDMMHVC